MYLAQSDFAMTLDWMIRLGLTDESSTLEEPLKAVADGDETDAF